MESCTVLLLKRFRNWLLRKKPPPKLMNPDVSPAMARDVGVTITRIRLPSGGEIVIVERMNDDEPESPDPTRGRPE